MEVAVFFISCEQLAPYGCSADFIRPYAILAVVFKAPLNLKYQIADQALHPLHHDHESISILIHEADVFLAEISPVKYEPYMLIPIALCLL